MATTTQLLPGIEVDISDYAGEFADDYDMPSVQADYIAAINEAAPEGFWVSPSGDIYAEIDRLDDTPDWDELLEAIDVAAIFERHDLTREASE